MMRHRIYSKSGHDKICFGSKADIIVASSAMSKSWLGSPVHTKGLSSVATIGAFFNVASIGPADCKKLVGLIYSQIARILSTKLSLTVSANPLASSAAAAAS